MAQPECPRLAQTHLRVSLSLDILSGVWILADVWLVLALVCAGGSSFEMTRTTAPMRWVVEGWPLPVSYGTHIAVDLCNGGPRPPTKCLSGSLVVYTSQVSTTHAQERCTSLPPSSLLACMQGRVITVGNLAGRSDPHIRLVQGSVLCRLRGRIPLQQTVAFTAQT